MFDFQYEWIKYRFNVIINKLKRLIVSKDSNTTSIVYEQLN